MNLDERARRAAEDVKAAAGTTDFDDLRARVRVEVTEAAKPQWRQSLAAVAAVVLVLAGIALGLLLSRQSSGSRRFSSVGSAIGTANDVVVPRPHLFRLPPSVAAPRPQAGGR